MWQFLGFCVIAVVAIWGGYHAFVDFINPAVSALVLKGFPVLEFLVLTNPFIFIPLALLLLGIEAVLVEKSDSYGWAFVVFLASMALLQVFSNIKPFSLIFENPLSFLAIVGLYLVAGAGWTVIKWFSYNRQVNDAVAEIYQKVAKDDKILNGTDAVAAQKRHAEILEGAERTVIGYSTHLPLQVNEHKAKITAWLAYWPASFAYTFFDDPVRRLLAGIVNALGGTLQRISDNATARLNAKIPVPTRPVTPVTPPPSHDD